MKFKFLEQLTLDAQRTQRRLPTSAYSLLKHYTHREQTVFHSFILTDMKLCLHLNNQYHHYFTPLTLVEASNHGEPLLLVETV